MSSYTIELDKWGITQGIPSKPYVSGNYFMASSNIMGINNALVYARDNGFNKVLLPKGEYALCYPNRIEMVDNITFDLMGSKLKVIYDSDNKSPFDTSTNPSYKFGGFSIEFSNVSNSHLVNGRVIGCRDDRSFSSTGEVSVEWTYGVAFNNGANGCSVRHCKVSDYMGDNVTFGSSTSKCMAEWNQNNKQIRLDYATGLPTTKTDVFSSDFVNLPMGDYTDIMITGEGYSRLTGLASKYLDIFWYGDKDSFIGVSKLAKVYSYISVPVGAKKFKMQYYNEVGAYYKPMTINFGRTPHHNVIEFNEIFNGHRGGITLGGNYNIIQHNIIRDNGKGSYRFLDGKPCFNYSTRYSINQEDSYGDNSIIRNNLIYNSLHGILLGAYSAHVENNLIYNIDGVAVNIYTTLFTELKGNIFDNCSVNVGLMTNALNGTVSIIDNFFNGGSLKANGDGAGYQVVVSDNQIVDPTMIAIGEDGIFEGNRIMLTDNGNGTVLSAKRLYRNKIKSSGRDVKTLTLGTSDSIQDCEFNRVNINIQSTNTSIREVEFNNCYFVNSSLRYPTWGSCGYDVKVKKSKLIDTVFSCTVINALGKYSKIELDDCDLISNTLTYFFYNEVNANDKINPSSYNTLKKSNITINNSNFACILKTAPALFQNSVRLEMTGNELTYTGTSPINFSYRSESGKLDKLISYGNQFNNFILPTDEQILVNYDTKTIFKQSISVVADANGNYTSIINHNLNTLEPYVFCVSDSSQIVQPIVNIIDANNIKLTFANNVNINVVVKKI